MSDTKLTALFYLLQEYKKTCVETSPRQVDKIMNAIQVEQYTRSLEEDA